ncbi:MAG: glycine--tRNA ligase subunit beta, partial [Prochlorotrichaceae cyanobacterium]
MATFLLEVGVEELPAQFVDSALQQWQGRVPADLAAAELIPSDLQFYGTPRRLAIVLTGLPDRQADRVEEIKGPPAQAAFKDGQPTRAAEGFAQKQGVSLEDFEIRPTEKGEFVFVQKQIPGRSLAEILTELVPQWIFGLEGKRFMRWGDGDLRFSRPIRWLVSLLDDRVLPLSLTDSSLTVQSDRLSQGHRVLHPAPVTIAEAGAYAETLAKAFVLVDVEQRREQIREQVKAAAAQVGGVAEIPEDLLAEVTQLVEWPTAVVGNFEATFLKLPPEVITTVMISHQRYFPIRKPDAPADADCTAAAESLFPQFITLSNGDPAKSTEIAAGNGRVIRARLADGEFFYKADCKQPLEAFLPQLETVTFQEVLGSLRLKVDRIVEGAAAIVSQLNCSPTEARKIQRAALLCKADLVSQMVFEFPELQGVMGQKYALVGQEDPEVATAIREHYLPRGAGDDLPHTLAGQVSGIADRLDTLVCIFGLGLLPSGCSDPFALRRSANAVVNILWAANLSLNLQDLLQSLTTSFVRRFPDVKTEAEELRSLLTDFFLQRLRTLLQEEQGIEYDLVNAVLGENDAIYRERALSHPLDVLARAKRLQSLMNSGELELLYEALNRSARLAQQGSLDYQTLDPVGIIQPDRFQQPTEQALYDALIQLLPETQTAQQTQEYDRLVMGLVAMAPTVRDFFDGENSVMV